MRINKIILIIVALLLLVGIGVGGFLYYQSTTGNQTPQAQYNALQCDFNSISNVSCRADDSGKSCPPCEFPNSAYCYVDAPGHPGYFCGCGKPGCNWNVVSQRFVCSGSETDPNVGWSWDGDISCPNGKVKCNPGDNGCNLERQVKGRCSNCSNPSFIKVYCRDVAVSSSSASASSSVSSSSSSSSTSTSSSSSSSSSSASSSSSSSSVSSATSSQPPAPETAIGDEGDQTGTLLVSIAVLGLGALLFMSRKQYWLFIKAEEMFGEGVLIFANKDTRKKVFENKITRVV